MSWRARNVDCNHVQIREGLQAFPGVSVVPLIVVGNGCPDLLVGFRSQTFLLEVKSPLGKKGGSSKKMLRKTQRNFVATWHGHPVAVVRSLDEALEAIGAKVSPNRVPAPLEAPPPTVPVETPRVKRLCVPRTRKRVRMGQGDLRPVQVIGLGA